MSIIDRVIMELSRPDDFGRDWYGWVTNQMGHVVLGIMVTMAAIVLNINAGSLAWIFLLATGKEIYDLTNGGKVSDGFMDWCFMIIGGVFSLGIYDKDHDTILYSMVIIAVGLIMGALMRLKQLV